MGIDSRQGARPKAASGRNLWAWARRWLMMLRQSEDKRADSTARHKATTDDKHAEQRKVTSRLPNNSRLQSITTEDVDSALQMLKQHVQGAEIGPLVAALEALKENPQDRGRQEAVAEAFDALGIVQGAVLTYAPLLQLFVSVDPFDD